MMRSLTFPPCPPADEGRPGTGIPATQACDTITLPADARDDASDVRTDVIATPAVPEPPLVRTRTRDVDQARRSLSARMPAAGQRWHLVCRVIDNFGDVGVLWRLARQLADEHGLAVDFFIDEPACLWPMAPGRSLEQRVDGLHVRLLDEAAPVGTGAAVVVSGFQARLPAAARQALRQQARPPLLVQLEYLSAEDWIESCHGLPSLHADGLREHFFHPGFSPACGGLLLERDLLARRDAFQADAAGCRHWLASHGVQPRDGERLASVLCYAQAPLPALARQWLADRQNPPLHLLLPGAGTLGRAAPDSGLPDADTQPHRAALQALAADSAGRLRVSTLPFLAQPDFDHLLWCCDLNLVRGEDSWVRALWAGRPWLWQAYPQAGEVHLDKLTAFLQRCRRWLSSPSASPAACALPAWQAAMRAWNQAPDSTMSAIPTWLHDPAAPLLAQTLSGIAASQAGDLASRLVDFVVRQRTPACT